MEEVFAAVILAMKSGAPRGIRTPDPRFRSLSVGLFPTNFEAKLLFCACLYFSFKDLIFYCGLETISANLVPFFLTLL